MQKIVAFYLASAVLVSSYSGEAQQPAKVARIGVLHSASSSTYATRTEAFRRALQELGYIEGQNIVIEERYGEGKIDRLPQLATELVSLKVDVIVAGGVTAIRTAKKGTGTIPIVMSFSSDPVAAGLVASLARPGGNITGLSVLGPELGGKQLELLKEMLPHLSRVAILGDSSSATYGVRMREIEMAGRALGVQVQPVELRGPDDLEKAFSAMAKGRIGALIGLQNPAFGLLRGRIAELAAKSRIATAYIDKEFVHDGGLMSYGTDYDDLYRRAAVFVDKILKGVKPADLPVEQPVRFECVINLKTAKQIRLTIPPNVLARADRVIR